MLIKSVVKLQLSGKIEKHSIKGTKKEAKLLPKNYKKKVKLDHQDLETLLRLVQ
jgi:hypothetical protein